MRNRILIIALRTALFYGGVASAWILLSDFLMGWFTSDAGLLERISSYKGVAFVIVTSTLLFFEFRRQLQRLAREADARRQAETEIRRSEDKFQSYVANAPVAVMAADGRGRFLDANPAASELLGHGNEELLSLGIADVVAPADGENLLRELAGLEIQAPFEKECVLLKRDGGRAFVWLKAVKTGEDHCLLFCQDITRLKQNEEALQNTNAQVQLIIDNNRDVIFQIDLEGNYVFGNAAAERVTGYPLSQLLQMSMWQLVSPEHHPMLRERLRRRIAGETMESSFEFEIRHRDGHRIWVELTTSGVTDARGKLKAIQGVARDISDRKQAEDKFLREQARFKLIFETIPIGIAFHTMHPNGSVTRMINDAHLHICGLSRADHDLPDIYRQITHPDDYALQQQWNEQIRAGHIKQFSMEKRYLRRDGQLVWVIFSYQRETYPDGTIEELTTVMDITERKLQEEQLRKLSRAVECSPASIIITNPAGDIDYVNPKFTAVTGYTLDEVRGKNPRLLKGSETSLAEYEQLWQAITAGREWRGVFHNRKKNGEMFWESASISPVTDKAGRITHFLAVKEDISKDRLLEEQFRQMQKMEAIGRLAGGVAHDFNNILAIILMQAELMAAEAALSPDLREFATEISKAAQRGANLTRQLLLFSRRQVMQTCDLDLNEVVNNLMKMLQRILGEDIRIHFKVSPRPLILRADAGMLDQVLMNLSVNARDAMPKGGELTIQTSAEQFDELTASQFPQARPGAFGCLTVSDTGHGISPEILPLIFDPFFTTKEAGKGTGLGLATVFSIVQQHQGWIDVYSQVEHGTTFRIFFPLQTAAQTSGLASPRKTPLPRGTETILLVEDESSLRTLLANILAQLGYRVLDAADSSVALDLWARHADKIDLLLTDLMLPDGMNGRELADQLLAARPNLKVLYASGYSAEVAGKDLPLQEGVNFLAKPFHAHRLAQAVRSRLDARDTAPRKSGPTAQLASS